MITILSTLILCRKNNFALKKQYWIGAIIAVVVIACGQQNELTKDKEAGAAKTDVSSHPDYLKGVELVAKNDCLGCHKVDEKVLGPGYREVANKYDNNDSTVAMLAQKVIKGGQGVWGQVPMTAHPQLSEADAKQMIKYIMLLKSN